MKVETVEQAEQGSFTEESLARPVPVPATERAGRADRMYGVHPEAALPASPALYNPPTQQLVSVSREIVQGIADLVGEDAVARFIDDVLRRTLQSHHLRLYLAELAEENGGPLTPEGRVWAAALPWRE